MENYEEKYKQALENAKQGKTIEEIFPELAESEDEKIRKSIIELLNEVHLTFKYYDINKMLAWLEKQGEQKSTWSEEDETALGDALWCCKQAASIAKDENDMGNAWYAENWLKSLKDRYIPLLKQEWSEEEELTEFEKDLQIIISEASYWTSDDGMISTYCQFGNKEIKKISGQLLDLARKELEKEIGDKCWEAHLKGEEEALKDLPKWKKDNNKLSAGVYAVENRGNGNIVLSIKDWYINILELIDKLPKEE